MEMREMEMVKKGQRQRERDNEDREIAITY